MPRLLRRFITAFAPLPPVPAPVLWRLLEQGFAPLRSPSAADYMPPLAGVAAFAANGSLIWLAWALAALASLLASRHVAARFDMREAAAAPDLWGAQYAACLIGQAALTGIGGTLAALHSNMSLGLLLLGALGFVAGRAASTAAFGTIAAVQTSLLLAPLGLALLLAGPTTLQALGMLIGLQVISAATLAHRAAAQALANASIPAAAPLAALPGLGALVPSAENFQRLLGRDRITGLPNRLSFMHLLAQESARAFRAETSLSLLLVWWEEYEGALEAGRTDFINQQISTMADRLRESLARPLDRLASLGQGRFAVLLPFTDTLGAAVVARKIQSALGHVVIDEHTKAGGSAGPVSIGAATYCGKGLLPEAQLLQFAEQALLSARRAGGDRIKRYDPMVETLRPAAFVLAEVTRP